MDRTTVWLSPEDKAVFADVQAMYGCDTFSQAVRMAGRIALQTGRLNNTALSAPKVGRARKRRNPNTGSAAHDSFFAHMLELADVIQLEGLPEDFSERLDDYMHQEIREQLR